MLVPNRVLEKACNLHCMYVCGYVCMYEPAGRLGSAGSLMGSVL